MDYIKSIIFKKQFLQKNKLQKAFYSRRDPKHVEACRKAILTYANEIRDYIPQLSKDLIEKYS